MNVDTSTTTSSSRSSETGNTQSKSSQSTKNESDTSFKDELKTVSSEENSKISENKAEENSAAIKNDNNDADSKEDTNSNITPVFSMNGELDFTDYKYSNMHQSLLEKNIQDLMNTQDMLLYGGLRNSDVDSASINYQNIQMSDGDALFFANLVQNTDMSMQTISSQLQNMMDSNVQETQQTAQVSATLLNSLSEAMKTNQPVRIDFDKDVSVIIRIDKDGNVSANFIPGDKAVEQYLKNNIGFLKQRFDEQELPYSNLSYSHSKEEQQEENQKRNKKENKNE